LLEKTCERPVLKSECNRYTRSASDTTRDRVLPWRAAALVPF
jgi:hypothetical protein